MADTQALTPWEDFSQQLAQRADEIASQLPSNVSREKFTNATIAAVKQDPNLLTANPRSIFKSITQAAQDGLLPDGREGVITVYKGEAKWNPMTHGIRKRARELDDIIVDAQVVYENDEFVWHQGDDPRITHTPAPLGQDRGQKIGAYAIAKKAGVILHREVMDFGQIEKVKSCSKLPDGLLWTKFEEEAWRKTVVRRGMKSVPVSAALEEIIRRDDDQFNFEQGHDPVISPPRASDDNPFRREQVTERVVSPAVIERTTRDESGEIAKIEVVEEVPKKESMHDKVERERQAFLKQAYAELAKCTLVREVPALYDQMIAVGVMTKEDEVAFDEACDKRMDEIMRKKGKAK